MDLLEILEIKKAIKNNKNLTNEQTEFYVSPLLKSVIQFSLFYIILNVHHYFKFCIQFIFSSVKFIFCIHDCIQFLKTPDLPLSHAHTCLLYTSILNTQNHFPTCRIVVRVVETDLIHFLTAAKKLAFVKDFESLLQRV